MEAFAIAVIVVTWLFMALVPVKMAAHEFEIGHTRERKSVSIIPVIPIAPLFVIGFMYAINFFADPMGTYAVVVLQLILTLFSIYSYISWKRGLSTSHAGNE